MTDAYENFFGLNPHNPADALIDSDGDGLRNADEAKKWTDPFAWDTDRDGWSDGCDSNPVSRMYMGWGDPLFTTNNNYEYTWPAWGVAAFKIGGEWLTNASAFCPEPMYGWHVSASAASNTGSLNIEVDRTILTNDAVLKTLFHDHPGASLYVDLYNTNEEAILKNLCGNLISGSNRDVSVRLDIPFEAYRNAVGIRLRRGAGEATVYESLLYVDKDHNGSWVAD